MMIKTTINHSRLLSQLDALRPMVGNTPLVALRHFLEDSGSTIFAKQEWKQLSGSVKCRAAYFIIRDAVEKDELNEDICLLDATSGNTGIAYASICRLIGIRVKLCIPENASRERKQILESLGAELILISKFEGTDGAQEVARDIAASDPGKYFYADQYKNENNWLAHYHTTASEIIIEKPGITHFICGLGTTGTFTGTSRKLKHLNPGIRVIALQPDSALHALEGWKHMETAKLPGIYDPDLADEIIEVSTEEAYDYMDKIYRLEGWLVSPSAAANVAGAVKLAKKTEHGIIVTVLADNGDKYGDIIKKIL